jgi:hypothetical protein
MKYDETKGETGIVWLHAPNDFRFVRVAGFNSHFFTKPPKKLPHHEILVGYTTGGKRECDEYPHKMRRLFYVMKSDFSTYLDGCPMEAVDPFTLTPNEPGIVTERAWNGPLPNHSATP